MPGMLKPQAGQAGQRSASCGCRAPPGSIALPLEQLSKEAVDGLGCNLLAVLVTADLRGQQACVRLRNVFGYRDTVLVTDWEEVSSC
jgi:hypothetical protein